MERPLIQQAFFPWAIGIIIGLPLLLILLGEVAERLRSRANPLAEGVLRLRHVVLPLLALLLLLRQVFGVAEANPTLRLIESIFWIATITVGLTLLGNLTQLRQAQPMSLVAKVPGLFFALGRALLVLFVSYYVLSGIWQVDVSNLFTAVGIGALAISFALQDTLSNLVSGFLLLVDRPFQPGDFVEIDGEEGYLIVEEVNWRAVRFRSHANWAVKIIPNGTLGSASITNFGQRNAPFKLRFLMNFSFDDPPNLARRMLLEILENEPGILSVCQPNGQPTGQFNGQPNVLLWEYGDSSIAYRLECFVNFAERDQIADRVKTKIYYAAQRHGLTIPFPIGIEYNLNDMRQLAPNHNIEARLRAIPLLQMVPPEENTQLIPQTRLSHYGAGERIIILGQRDEGFYLIQRGQVRLSAVDPQHQEQTIAHLTTNDFFGAIDILRPGEPRQISATAIGDVTVLIVADEMIRQLIERYPGFAMELNYFVEARMKAVDALAVEHATSPV